MKPGFIFLLLLVISWNASSAALPTILTKSSKHENRRPSPSESCGNVQEIKSAGLLLAEIETPYPTSIELKQINSAEKERIRLAHAQKKYDRQPTGFYVYPGKKLVVNVEELVASEDGKPVLTVGTLGMIDNSPKDFQLKTGKNIIDGTQHSGGLVYLSYITHKADFEPQGKVKVEFAAESEHVRAPKYVFGVTGEAEFESMLEQYTTPDVLFYSDYAVVLATRANAISLSVKEDKQKWMETLHMLLETEDEISGLDNADSNPIHHRLHAGEVRHLFTENASPYPHASSAGYTGYPAGHVWRYLTYTGIYDRSWMIGHEVGHQHQQNAYKINKATESTVNIYSYVVERRIQHQKGNLDYNRTSSQRWQQVHNTYLKLPVEQRIYDMDDQQLKAITGFDVNELRFMPWEQLFLAFGDEFYKQLHRVTREEGTNGGTENERRAYLIWKASKITGYDLRGFFNQWGIRLTTDYDIQTLNQKISKAMEAGKMVELPHSAIELTQITGQALPEWCPLPLIGEATPDVVTQIADIDWAAAKKKYCDYSNATGTITDARDGKTYFYKKYGKLDWFTENLNYVDERLNNPSDPNMPKNVLSIYPETEKDPTGEVFGRMYVTYASREMASDWCPDGWRAANQQDWSDLYAAIKAEYGLAEDEVASCLVCGGDQDIDSDGLWQKGALGSKGTNELRKQVGFNILPAGVYNINTSAYDQGDEKGNKASFFDPSSVWYHQIFTASSLSMVRKNRNSRHYASVRCVRTAAEITAVYEKKSGAQLRVFPNPAKTNQPVYVELENSTQQENQSILVYDISGHKIQEVPVTANRGSFYISTAGVYVLKLKSDKGIMQQKLIVK